MISAFIKSIQSATSTKDPELHKVKTMTNGNIFAMKQIAGATLPAVVIQLVGIDINPTKDGGSSTDVNKVEITTIAESARDAWIMATLLRKGFENQSFDDSAEGVYLADIQFSNWASDVFEGSDLFTITLQFDAFQTQRQNLSLYI